MSNDLVLAALAAAEEREGNVHWAHEAVRRADPLKRGGLRKRVNRAVSDAQDLSGGGTWGDDGPRHLMRVAYLLAADADPTQDDIAELDAIQRLFDAEKAKHPSNLKTPWTLTFAVIIAVVAVAAGVGLTLFLTRERIPSLEGARRKPPGPAGAYARGGVPKKEHVHLRVLFRTELIQYSIAIERLADARRAEAGARVLRRFESELRKKRQAVLRKRNLKGLGEHAAKRVADLLEAMKVAELTKTTKLEDDTVRGFHRAIDFLNQELAAGDFAYHVIGDVLLRGGRRLFLLATYHVERVVHRKVEGLRVTLLHLDRLDRTNWKPNRLGAHRPTHLAPFVEMSTVRRDLLTFTIPELMTQGGLVYKGERLSNQMVRKDHRAIFGKKVDDLVAFGTQLEKRRRILRRIQRHGDTKVQFLFPDTMKRDHELLQLFRKDFNAPVHLANEYETVLGAIDVPAYRGLVGRLAAVHAGPVEHFVLQMWFDHKAGVPAMPPKVAAHLKGLLESTKHNKRVAAAARDQLSGQLAELAGSAPLTRTVLTKLSGNIFDASAWDTPRCFASMILFKEVARVLGVAKGAELKPGARPDRELASHVYAHLLAKKPALLRGAARTAWAHLFGRKMPQIHGAKK